MKRLLLLLIRLYQRYVSPIFPARCRFYPTCSAYAAEAIARFGAVKGGWLTLKRILRCHPLCHGGIDPVPATFTFFQKRGRTKKNAVGGMGGKR